MATDHSVNQCGLDCLPTQVSFGLLLLVQAAIELLDFFGREGLHFRRNLSTRATHCSVGTSTDVARELATVQSAFCGCKLQATQPASHACVCYGQRHLGLAVGKTGGVCRAVFEPKGAFIH